MVAFCSEYGKHFPRTHFRIDSKIRINVIVSEMSKCITFQMLCSSGLREWVRDFGICYSFWLHYSVSEANFSFFFRSCSRGSELLEKIWYSKGYFSGNFDAVDTGFWYLVIIRSLLPRSSDSEFENILDFQRRFFSGNFHKSSWLVSRWEIQYSMLKTQFWKVC